MPRRVPTRWLIPVAVLGGLFASVVLVASTAEPVRDLPGVALESDLILAVEQVLVLFAAWMTVVIVVTRAVAGDLPYEISGQGLKYADRDAAADVAAGTRSALRDLRGDVNELQQTVFRSKSKG